MVAAGGEVDSPVAAFLPAAHDVELLHSRQWFLFGPHQACSLAAGSASVFVPIRHRNDGRSFRVLLCSILLSLLCMHLLCCRRGRSAREVVKLRPSRVLDEFDISRQKNNLKWENAHAAARPRIARASMRIVGLKLCMVHGTFQPLNIWHISAP